MNILFARDYPKIDGVYLLLLRLAKQYHQLGHQVFYLSYGKDHEEVLNELRAVCTVLNFSSLEEHKRRGGRLPTIDIIQPFLAGDRFFQLMGTVHSRWFPNAKLVIGIYHGLAFITKTKWGLDSDALMYRYILQKIPSQNLIFMHQDMKMRHEEELSVRLPYSNVIPLPVELPARPIVPVPQNRYLIVSVGRLISWKSYNIKLLPAIQRLRHEGYPIVYKIYGEGPNREAVIAAIKEYGLEDAVIMCGEVSLHALKDAIVEGGMFVGCGTAVVQAAGWCVPTAVAIVTENRDESYGWIANVEDSVGDILPNQRAVSYYDLIKEMVQLNEEEYTKLALACYNSVYRQYNIDSIAERYLDVYSRAQHMPPLPINRLKRFVLKFIRQFQKPFLSKYYSEK